MSVEIDMNCLIKKSGTDFMELSHLTLRCGEPSDDDFCYNDETGVATWFEKAYTNDDVEPDSELKAHVDKLMQGLNDKLDVLLGYVDVDLDLHFSIV